MTAKRKAVPSRAISYETVRNLLFAYARAIDSGEFEAWPEFFVEDATYKILPRENADRGLPLAVMLCDSKNMMLDRIRALREANIYNIHYPRHTISNIELLERNGRTCRAVSNYVVYQTDQEGRTTIYSVGQYADVIVADGDGLKFKEKVVRVDTFGIPNLVALPI